MINSRGFAREGGFNHLVAGLTSVASGTPASLTSSGVFVDYVSVKSHFENTSVVFIGPSGNSNYHLGVNDSIDIGLVDLQTIQITSNVGTQKVAYLGGRF